MEQIIIRKLDRTKQYLQTGFTLVEAYLCSDEANCYHNNYLIAVAREIGKRVGVAIVGYDCSEPQQGKDICGRIICL